MLVTTYYLHPRCIASYSANRKFVSTFKFWRFFGTIVYLRLKASSSDVGRNFEARFTKQHRRWMIDFWFHGKPLFSLFAKKVYFRKIKTPSALQKRKSKLSKLLETRNHFCLPWKMADIYIICWEEKIEIWRTMESKTPPRNFNQFDVQMYKLYNYVHVYLNNLCRYKRTKWFLPWYNCSRTKMGASFFTRKW